MRPEDFKLNSDYISTATESNFTTAVIFPGGVSTGTVINNSLILDAPFTIKSYCVYMLSLDGVNWINKNDYGFYSGNFLCVLTFERIGNKSIKATLSACPTVSGTQTLPPMTVYIKETAIYTPDMD